MRGGGGARWAVGPGYFRGQASAGNVHNVVFIAVINVAGVTSIARPLFSAGIIFPPD